MAIPTLKNLIGGEWQESQSTEFLEVKNPAFDETIALGAQIDSGGSGSGRRRGQGGL